MKQRYRILPFGMMVAIVVSGCISLPVRAPVPVASYEDEHIVITATYIPKEELNRRYGRPNPFVGPALQITRFEFVVFDVVISAKSDNIVVNRDEALFQLDDVPGFNQNENLLRIIWEKFTSPDEESSVQSRGERLIRRQMLLDPVRLAQANDVAVGLVVFRGLFSLDGKALILFPYTVVGAASGEPVDIEANALLTPMQFTQPVASAR